MTIETLSKFLRDANKATYANKDASKAPALRPESLDYHFEKDGFTYHDTYFGNRSFVGEEIVYEREKPVWGANYFGFILEDNTPGKDVYDFLQDALMREDGDIVAVREPHRFSAAGKEYRFSVDGNLSNFSGTEEILLDGKVVYRCFVHGGMIN